MNCRYYILRKGTNTPIYDERFLVDIAHRPSSTKTFAYSNLGGMGIQYNEFLRELGKDINKPFNLPFCTKPEKMYSFVCIVYSQTVNLFQYYLNQIQAYQSLIRILELFQNTFFNSFRTMDT